MLSTYSTRRFAGMLLFCVALGAGIVTGTKWSMNILYPKTMVVRTSGFAPDYGSVDLSVTAVSQQEVLINVTFKAERTSLTTSPGAVWTVWISNSSVGFEARLPRGLNLVEGNLTWNGTYPVAFDSASVQAKALAVGDGKWTVYGKVSVTRPGWYVGGSSTGITITALGGKVVQLEREESVDLPSSDEPGEAELAEFPSSDG